MSINETNFFTLVEISRNQEGLVLLGTGGDLQEWIDGVSELLKEAGIASPEFEVTEAHKVTTSGSRDDLLLLFDWAAVDMGKLAIWRLSFGDCSWLSDYVRNYSNEHFFKWIDQEELESAAGDD